MKRVAALIVSLAACGTGTIAAPPPAPVATLPPDFASGTRIRAVVYEVDGTSSLEHFFDLERNEACAFIEDGIAHVGPGPAYWCLPLLSAVHDEADSSLAIYADRDCTKPLAVVPPTGATPYAIMRATNTCSTVPAIYHADAAKRTRPWVKTDAGCTNEVNTALTQALLDEIPLDSFVRADEHVADGGGRIAPLVAVTADGAKQTIGGFDHARNGAASVSDPGAAGDPRWFPARIAFTGASTPLYGDASCGVELPTKLAHDAVCPIGAAFTFTGGCGAGTFIEVGPAPDGSTLHEMTTAGACIVAPTSAVSGAIALTRGSEIPRPSFAPAYSVERGGNTVHQRGWSDGVAAPAWTELVDLKTRALCTPTLASDGKLRCLPSANATLNLFSDAKCTVPAYEVATSTCAPSPTPAYVTASGHVYQVTGTQSALFEATATGCVAHKPAGPSQGFTVQEAAVTSFALVTERQL